ncbi:hypothetical protein SLA2020_271710 [Shorea laevis]
MDAPIHIGTGTRTRTPSSSATASCYPHCPTNSAPTPIDVEEGSDDIDSDEFDTYSVRSVGAMPNGGRGRGGRPPLPNKKRTRNVSRKSAAWDHFTKDVDSPEDLPVAHCNYCRAEFKCHGKTNGTSNMLYHVRSCSKLKSLKSQQDRSQSKLTFGARQSESGDSCNNLMIAKYSEKHVRESLCEMIILDEMPFSIVERMRFKKLFRVIEPQFKLPSRYTMMKDCVNLYMKTKNAMKTKFMATGQRICLTIDT